jgi:hypothetical protein
MRYALIGFAVLISSGVAHSQDYTSSQYCDPWCFQGNKSDGLDCSYRTLAQCNAFGWGVGGTCVENPFLSYCTRGRPAQTQGQRSRPRSAQ